MFSDFGANIDPEVRHILLIDILGYSKLTLKEKRESLHKLSQVVRNSEAVITAEAADELLELSTGNGLALAFADAPDVPDPWDAPVRCAIQVSKGMQSYPEVKMRMGIHSGQVNRMVGPNDRVSVSGEGINLARQVTDCGDAGHILLSKQVAGHLAQSWRWPPHLHDLGECELMSGDTVSLVNFYREDVGNRSLPKKFKRGSALRPGAVRTVRFRLVSAQNVLLTILCGSLVATAVGCWIFFQPVGPRVQIPTAVGNKEDHTVAQTSPTPTSRLATHQ